MPSWLRKKDLSPEAAAVTDPQAEREPLTAFESRFPEPPVIGKGPSFAPGLGPLPASVGAMSGQAVPDTALDGTELPGLTVRGASIRGDDHRFGKEIRQDSMGMWTIDDGRSSALLVCVADGVGSQPLSHLGAAEACRLLRDLAAPHVSRFFRVGGGSGLADLWKLVADQIGDQLNALAAQLSVDPRELSTTLAAAIIETSPASDEERRYAILNVGDATAFVLRDGEFLDCLVDPFREPEAITSTATWALPASIGQVGTANGIIGSRDMLMVCTDGMSNPMRNRDVCDRLAGWWDGDQIPGMQEFGWQMSYRVRSFGDDRTAVCVWGRGK